MIQRDLGRIFENHVGIRDLVTSGAARDVTAGNVDAEDRCVCRFVCLSVGSGGCHGKEKMPHGSSPSPATATFSAVPITSAPFVSGSGFVRRRDVFPSPPLLPRSSTPLLARSAVFFLVIDVVDGFSRLGRRLS